MRKINKILSGVTAATVAFGSLAAYVAFADATAATKLEFPSIFVDEGATALKALYSVDVTDDNVVTIDYGTKTKTEVEAVDTDSSDPIYIGITIDDNIADGDFMFAAGSGYELDDPAHPEYNYASKQIKLWLPAVSEDDIVVKYADTNSSSDVKTITIKYKFADPVEDNSEEVDVTIENEITTELEGVDPEDVVEITAADKSNADGETVDITVTITGDYEIEDIKFNGEDAVSVEGDVYTVTLPADDEGTYTITVTGTLVEADDEDDGNGDDNTSGGNTSGGDTSDDNTSGGNTSGGNTSGGDTSKPDDDKPTTPDEMIAGEADVTPGEDTTIETEAGNITVKTDAEDTALTGTKFVVETVEDAEDDLTEAVGANATAETKAAVEEAAEAVEDGNAVILDLSFVDEDGNTVQPGKAVTVELPVPAALKDAETVYVYHVGEDGIILVATSAVTDGKISFTTDKFSPYIFSKVELKKASAGKTDEPSTSEPGDTSNPGSTGNPSTGIALAVAPVVLAAGAFVVTAFKKKH